MLKNLRLLLLPMSVIYGLIILIRNKLYDWGIFNSTTFNLPIICIGNLAVGGAGKTPVTEYLVRLLTDKKIAILSRGYGRTTKGFILADQTATAQTIGDEPLQYYKKFKNVTVAVCEDRVKGVELLKDQHDVILLDDAFQHRAIKAGFNILLFEFEKMHQLQFMLPGGNLREPFYACKRADEILITKSPSVIPIYSRNIIQEKLNQTDVSFAQLIYGDLKPVFKADNKVSFTDAELFILTGIANPQPMLSYLKDHSRYVHHFNYPDHHQFTKTDIKKLIDAFNGCSALDKIIITTEKDSQRLLSDNLSDLLLNLPIYYLPIQIDLLAADKAAFDKKILTYVAQS